MIVLPLQYPASPSWCPAGPPLRGGLSTGPTSSRLSGPTSSSWPLPNRLNRNIRIGISLCLDGAWFSCCAAASPRQPATQKKHTRTSKIIIMRATCAVGRPAGLLLVGSASPPVGSSNPRQPAAQKKHTQKVINILT